MISLGNVTGDTYLIQLTLIGSVYTLMVKARRMNRFAGWFTFNNTIIFGQVRTTANDVRLESLECALIFGTNNAVEDVLLRMEISVGTSSSSINCMYKNRKVHRIAVTDRYTRFSTCAGRSTSQPFASGKYRVLILLTMQFIVFINIVASNGKRILHYLCSCFTTSLTIGTTTKVGHTTIYGNLTVSNPTCNQLCLLPEMLPCLPNCI